MSDTVVNDSPTAGTVDTSGFFLDGEAPRLAAATTIAGPPPERKWATAPALQVPPTVMPTLPVVSPVLTAAAAPLLPSPTGAVGHSAAPADGGSAATDPEARHPMAHLMPSKSIPNEASRRAAEKRAAHKTKAKRIKIGVITGMIAFMAIVGPPLGRWLVDAINEAGNTSTVVDTPD